MDSISDHTSKWQILGSNGENFDGYDVCIFAAPYQQIINLWNSTSKIKLPLAKSRPCWALMLITKPIQCKFNASFIKSRDISWYQKTALTPKEENGLFIVVMNGLKKIWRLKKIK